MRKKLKELNLLDNFLFGQMVTYPSTGTEFVRILLQIIFGKDFARLTVIPQKVYYGNDTELHGVRLDVYIEDEGEGMCEAASGQATIYDIEPDKNDGTEDIRNLPRRVRFYHAKIDAENLKSGLRYGALKNVAVIMITSYDPFGYNRMVYTVKNRCIEEPDMLYEDGASTLFLYTKGTEGEADASLRQLLHYMEHSVPENAVNHDLESIHHMVTAVKNDTEVTVAYMRMMEDEDRLLAKGEARGEAKGEAKGTLKTLISLTCSKLKKAKTPEVIAEELEQTDVAKIAAICEAAAQYAPDYNVDAIYELLMQKETLVF